MYGGVYYDRYIMVRYSVAGDGIVLGYIMTGYIMTDIMWQGMGMWWGIFQQGIVCWSILWQGIVWRGGYTLNGKWLCRKINVSTNYIGPVDFVFYSNELCKMKIILVTNNYVKPFSPV